MGVSLVVTMGVSLVVSMGVSLVVTMGVSLVVTMMVSLVVTMGVSLVVPNMTHSSPRFALCPALSGFFCGPGCRGQRPFAQ